MFRRYAMLREVIVNLRTDKAFRGILWRRRRGYLVLRQAVLIQGRSERRAVDGEVMVEAANVDFVQVL